MPYIRVFFCVVVVFCAHRVCANAAVYFFQQSPQNQQGKTVKPIEAPLLLQGGLVPSDSAKPNTQQKNTKHAAHLTDIFPLVYDALTIDTLLPHVFIGARGRTVLDGVIVKVSNTSNTHLVDALKIVLLYEVEERFMKVFVKKQKSLELTVYGRFAPASFSVQATTVYFPTPLPVSAKILGATIVAAYRIVE